MGKKINITINLANHDPVEPSPALSVWNWPKISFFCGLFLVFVISLMYLFWPKTLPASPTSSLGASTTTAHAPSVSGNENTEVEPSPTILAALTHEDNLAETAQSENRHNDIEVAEVAGVAEVAEVAEVAGSVRPSLTEASSNELIVANTIAVEAMTSDSSQSKTDPAIKPIASNISGEPPALPAYLSRIQLSSAVINKEPIDKLNSINLQEQQQAVLFIEAIDIQGEKLIVEWRKAGRVIAKVNLAIGGQRWRTNASKRFTPEMKGAWQVAVFYQDVEVWQSAFEVH